MSDHMWFDPPIPGQNAVLSREYVTHLSLIEVERHIWGRRSDPSTLEKIYGPQSQENQ